MSENEEQAMNWTVGLVGSIALHVVVVGLFLTLGRATPSTELELGEAPSAAVAEGESREETETEAETEAELRPSGSPRVESSRVELATPSTTARVESVSPNVGDAKIYVVQRGDNASRIAQKHGLTLQELANLNNTTVRKLNEIAIGQKLKVAE